MDSEVAPGAKLENMGSQIEKLQYAGGWIQVFLMSPFSVKSWF